MTDVSHTPVETPITAKPKRTYPDKGFRGRKIIAGLSTAATVEALASVGWLLLDKMTAEQWMGVQTTVLIAVGVTLGLISMEKVMGKKPA